MKPTDAHDKQHAGQPDDPPAANFSPDIFRALFDISPDPLILTSQEGKIFRANRAAEKYFGYTARETADLTIFSLLPDHVADKLPTLLREEFRKNGLSLELPLKLKNGETRVASVLTRLVRDHGSLIRLVAVRSLPESVPEPDLPQIDTPVRSGFFTEIIEEPEMTFEIDIDGVFVSANTVCFAKTGYSKNDFKKGLRFTSLLDPSDRERALRDYRRLLDGEWFDAFEYSLLRKDGTSFPAVISLTLTAAKDNSPIVRGIALDLSEHKRIEENLLVREKLNVLGEIAGGVIHNFNNILSVIIGHIDLFSLGDTDEKTRGLIGKIHQAALDGTEMVKRIRNFSTVSDLSEAESVDVNAVITDVIEYMKPRIADPDRPIAITAAPGAIPPIRIVPFELREVLSNLIINSIDAMPKGGSVTVATGLSDGFVDISVADTGTGMSEDIKRRLFEPFFTTKKSRGTGIGMSVSYALVTKFGGRILVESKEGAGTTIRVLFPPAPFARQAEPRAVETTRIKAPRTQTPKQSAKAHRILVIDDEANICEILDEYLSRGGHEVVTASTGEDGLRLLENSAFDILITDLNMPRISGWDIARRVKHDFPSTLTIMLTGWGTNIEELNSREPVVDRLLFKPVNFARLSGIIAEAMDK